jgi:hypothetical protein
MIEEWKSLPEFAGYEVSNFGNLRCFRRIGGHRLSNGEFEWLDIPRLLNLVTKKPDKKYYHKIFDKKYFRYIHVLVIQNFGPPKPGPEYEVDHKDTNSLNNRIDNLRWVTHQQNNFAQKHQTVPKSSKYRGVSLNKKNGTWRAYIVHNAKMINIGSYKTPELAAEAHNTKAKELFGEYARLNVIQ